MNLHVHLNYGNWFLVYQFSESPLGVVYKPKYVTFMSESSLTLMRLIFVIGMSQSHSTTLTSLLAVGNN